MKLSLKQLRQILITLSFCLLAGALGYFLGTHNIKVNTGSLGIGSGELPKLGKVKITNTSTPADKDVDFNLFWEVWDRLEAKYLEKDKIDYQKMFYGAIEGMTASLGDPYTVFLPPKDNKQAKEDLNGSFEGVGIRLGFSDSKRLSVISPLEGSPAKAAGVRAGDLILHIKDEAKGIDEDTAGITLPEAVEKIRGPEGSKIYLTLKHEGAEDSFIAEITRGEIIVPSVEVEFLEDDKIAHLKLLRFGDLTAAQWDETIERIIDNPRIKAVILDVRGNPGGYLRGSINLASEFLEGGVIVKQEDYKGNIDTYSVNRRGRLLNIPLLVMIDKGSASASEILAGALRDHDRAYLLGETSFGKGTIQETEDLSEGAGLHITTAKWLTPNGTWLKDKGLAPDIEVKDDPETDIDEQLQKALEVLEE
jgi:carboxyl-terminal processing protease